MPSKINMQWHDGHPMPKPATLDTRVEWHLAHREHCACRAMPGSVLAELQRDREDLTEIAAPEGRALA